MIYNSIEEELWRIFTFYALHSDPTLPEVLKPPNFIKFCKDCQIVSKKFTTSSVELEIARLARMKSQGVDYVMTSSINFIDFMQLLEMISVKIYPRDSPEVAAKRLILENVLLLAHRRTPTNDYYDLNNPEALKLITETFSLGLTNIFNYYIAKAHLRRNNAVSAEKMKHKELLRQSGHLETDREAVALVISPARLQNLQYLKNLMKTQREMISYKEYLQFCQDFSLKSTALLTATQLGEVYLSVVPLQSSSSLQSESRRHHGSAGEGLMVSGMTFELFCRAIIYMALLAYRNLDAAVPTTHRVKALLLYMLKCTVDGNKTLKVLSKERSHTLSSSKSGLNLYGSTEFVAQFQAHWQREGYCDYTAPPQSAILTGTHMLRKVVGEAHEALEGASSSLGTPSHSHGNRARTSSLASVDTTSSAQHHTTVHTPGSGGGHRSQNGAHSPSHSIAWGMGGVLDTNNANGSKTTLYTVPGAPESTVVRPDFPVNLEAADLKLLLQKRPELVEFLHLEIEQMKLETERLTNME